MDEGEFSVVQYFETGECEFVRRWVSAREAVDAAKHYTSSIAAKAGIVRKVVIVDRDDCTNFLWEYGRGIVYPLRGADGRFHA